MVLQYLMLTTLTYAVLCVLHPSIKHSMQAVPRSTRAEVQEGFVGLRWEPCTVRDITGLQSYYTGVHYAVQTPASGKCLLWAGSVDVSELETEPKLPFSFLACVSCVRACTSSSTQNDSHMAPVVFKRRAVQYKVEGSSLVILLVRCHIRSLVTMVMAS